MEVVKVKLEKFIEDEKKRLDKFKEKWEYLAKQYVKTYPMEMSEGDWIEQFDAFTGMLD